MQYQPEYDNLDVNVDDEENFEPSKVDLDLCFFYAADMKFFQGSVKNSSSAGEEQMIWFKRRINLQKLVNFRKQNDEVNKVILEEGRKQYDSF